MKELWCYTRNRISVRFEYEWRDADNPGQWMHTHGNEHWEFDDSGLMRIRDMSANDYPIKESERRYRREQIVQYMISLKSKRDSCVYKNCIYYYHGQSNY